MQNRMLNSPETPIKAALNEPTILSPDGRNSLGYNPNLPTAYSTVRPVLISEGYPAGQVFMQRPSQVHIDTLQVHQHSVPFRTDATSTMKAPPIATNTALPPLVQRQSFIMPERIVEEIKIKRPVETIVQGEPEVITEVKYEKLKTETIPPVQIERKSDWSQYYGERRTYATPPPAAAAQEKSGCNPFILGILGVLALAGLITGIVLASRASNGYGTTSESPKPQTQGVPTDSNSSAPLVPTSPILPQPNATNTTAPTPIEINPISIAPQTIAADPSKTVSNMTTVWTAPAPNTTTAANTATSTNTSTNTTVNATTTSNSTKPSTGPMISQPIYEVASTRSKHRHRLRVHSLRQI